MANKFVTAHLRGGPAADKRINIHVRQDGSHDIAIRYLEIPKFDMLDAPRTLPEMKHDKLWEYRWTGATNADGTLDYLVS